MGPTRSEMGLSVTRCHDFGIGSIFLSIFNANNMKLG